MIVVGINAAAGLLTPAVAAARHSPRAKISCSSSSTDISPPPLPRRLRRLVAALHSAPDAKTRSLYLMRLGDKLPLTDALCAALGCPLGSLEPNQCVLLSVTVALLEQRL